MKRSKNTSLKSAVSEIKLENISKIYISPPATALDDVSIEFKAGGFYVLMGPSGCGKSTLLNIAGLKDRPSKGRVLLDGVDSATLSDDDVARFLARFGTVFQQFHLLPHMDAFDNVEMALNVEWFDYSRSERKARVEEVLSLVGLAGKAHNKPLQMSGGEEQRVGIARAIATNPSVIFADEPTGNLDEVSGSNVLEILADLCSKHGKTIIMVTHNPSLVGMLKGRLDGKFQLVEMRDGKIASVVRP